MNTISESEAACSSCNFRGNGLCISRTGSKAERIRCQKEL